MGMLKIRSQNNWRQGMNPKPNLLTQVAAALPGLSKSETKVAQAILADPEAATQSSIANLAKSAGVSEPSVNRFSKRFGAKGFPDFKIQLATSLVSGVRYMSQAVEPSDDIASYPFKLFDNTISALILARDALPTEAIAEAVQEMGSTELERAREVWRKKFGEPSADQAARAKQVRFLISRGFAAEVVKRVVAGADEL